MLAYTCNIFMNTENISRYIYFGRTDKDWYADCRATLVDLFGADRLTLVTDLLAATSINTSLTSNVTLFRRAYYEIKNDLPVGKYLPIIQAQLNQVRSGIGLTGRKIRSFAAAMRGDSYAVVVDIWLLRAFGEDRKYRRSASGLDRSGGPTDAQYSKIETWVRMEALYRGVTPAQLGACIWSGIRREVGRNPQTRYCDFLRYHLTNLYNVI